MRLSATLSFLGNTFHLKFQHFKTPVAQTIGVSSRVPRSTDFAIFLDFDNVVDERLADELLYLQELFCLGDFHIFKTNPYGRHVICLDRLPAREAYEVVYHSTSDYNFKRGIHINEFRTWVLRVAAKGNRARPKYCYSIESKYNGRNLQFEALGLFLKFYYNAPVRLVNPDGTYELEIQQYQTGSKLDVRKLKKVSRGLKR